MVKTIKNKLMLLNYFFYTISKMLWINIILGGIFIVFMISGCIIQVD